MPDGKPGLSASGSPVFSIAGVRRAGPALGLPAAAFGEGLVAAPLFPLLLNIAR